MRDIFLIEDHDEALNIWRQKCIRDLDLIHIDAHIDFGFQKAIPIEKAFNEARSLRDLKKNLELSIAYSDFEKDFNKQINIGNYISPAMKEGIVRNFYWVVPGDLKEFNKSLKFIRKLLKALLRYDFYRRGIKINLSDCILDKGIIKTNLFGRKFIICTLEKLPRFKKNILLDIDTDFLVIDSLINSDSTINISKRKPWILPKDLAQILRSKIEQPKITTIAYSVNGGYTPIKYKYFGNTVGYYLRPKNFKHQFEIKSQAASYFDFFCSSDNKRYYWKAVKLDSTYRLADNNYGPLYLLRRKFSLAEREFLRILKADSKNSASLVGLGKIALERKDYRRAKQYFYSVLKSQDNKLFPDAEKQSLLGAGMSEFHLGKFDKAKRLLIRYRKLRPLEPSSSYILGRIFEREEDFSKAASFYRDAIRLGFGSIDQILRLLRISFHLKDKDDIINLASIKYKEIKKNLNKAKRKKGKYKPKVSCAAKKKIKIIEQILKRRPKQCKKN